MRPAASWNREDHLVSLFDTGDGWFDSPSPLLCEIIAEGPGRLVPQGHYGLLLSTLDVPFRWHGSSAMLRRWGPDHPLADRLPDSTRALLCIRTPPPAAFSLVPVYVCSRPVAAVAEVEADAVWPGFKLSGEFIHGGRKLDPSGVTEFSRPQPPTVTVSVLERPNTSGE